MMDDLRQHIHGIIGATVFAVVMLLLLLLLGFSTPLPLPPEECIILDFGGGGNVNAGAASATSQTHKPSTINTTTAGVNTQDFEDAPSQFSSTVPHELSNDEHVVPDNDDEHAEPVDPRAEQLKNLLNSNLFGSGTGNAGTGTGSGNPGFGNAGSGGGYGNTPGGLGGGLGSRKVIKKVKPKTDKDLVGKVTFKISVNENGDVDQITLVATTCDECVDIAKAAVQQWKYERRKGIGIQTGEVVIAFQQQH